MDLASDENNPPASASVSPIGLSSSFSPSSSTPSSSSSSSSSTCAAQPASGATSTGDNMFFLHSTPPAAGTADSLHTRNLSLNQPPASYYNSPARMMHGYARTTPGNSINNSPNSATVHTPTVPVQSVDTVGGRLYSLFIPIPLLFALLQCQSQAWIKEDGDANFRSYHTDSVVKPQISLICYHTFK